MKPLALPLFLLLAFASSAQSAPVLDCGSVAVYAENASGVTKYVARGEEGDYLDDVEPFAADAMRGYRGAHEKILIAWTESQAQAGGKLLAYVEKDGQMRGPVNCRLGESHSVADALEEVASPVGNGCSGSHARKSGRCGGGGGIRCFVLAGRRICRHVH